MTRYRALSRTDRQKRGENGVAQLFALQSAIGNRASASLMREAATSSSSSAAPAAHHGNKHAYITITGEKQGKFKGSSAIKGREDDIEISSYEMGIKAPRDAATGQATGKRQHQGISFTKEIDDASPQLMQAMASNETLKQVTITFYRPSARTGDDQLYQTVTLTNAHVASWNQDFDGGDGHGGSDLERVQLVFDEIKLESNIGKTAAQDSWGGAQTQ